MKGLVVPALLLVSGAALSLQALGNEVTIGADQVAGRAGEVRIKGTITELTSRGFMLDGLVAVRVATPPPPEAVGRTVLVEGVVEDPDVPLVAASRVLIGCASKYDPV